MEAFTELTGIAAPLPRANVDTDMIIPKQHLKTIKRTGLGKVLFDELRYDERGQERPEFVLNQVPYRDARLLVAGDNFGCGSSREHAPWALLDFGIRCVIAPSFADIFYNNCLKNGILPVALPQAQAEALMADAQDPETATLTVNLEHQQIRRTRGEPIAFEIDAFRRQCLLEGLDDIALTLQDEAAIATFERQQREQLPWLWAS